MVISKSFQRKYHEEILSDIVEYIEREEQAFRPSANEIISVSHSITQAGTDFKGSVIIIRQAR